MLLCIFSANFLLICCLIAGKVDGNELKRILNALPGYEKEEIPTQDEGHPTVVTIQMYIEGMTSFRAQSNDFTIDIYFQERWMDKRLAHNGTKRILIKDRASFGQIWHPDAYDVEQLILKWKDVAAIDINSEIRMPDMRLRKLEPTSRNDSYATGTWSCAIVYFSIDRELTHHIIQTYMPSGLIVTISFFSFWLDVDAVPGRVSLSIMTILTVATQNSAAKMALPQASDLKAIDIWMGACLTFVFSTMIEFTVVNFCVRRKPRNRTKRVVATGIGDQVNRLVYSNKCMINVESPLHQRNATFFDDQPCHTPEFKIPSSPASIFPDRPDPNNTTPPTVLRRYVNVNGMANGGPNPAAFMNNTEEWKRNQRMTRTKKKVEERMLRAEENRQLAVSIDRKSRLYFPLAFLLFNVVYWWYYLYTSARD
uniref:Neur_chan_memb domain-containing protein n=1 Tax=Panagrellus redivivus TaxID=6233 RepID=A0A7E4VLP7_PANRE